MNKLYKTLLNKQSMRQPVKHEEKAKENNRISLKLIIIANSKQVAWSDYITD